MKKILLSICVFALVMYSENINAQRTQNETVITGGVGYSLGMTAAKGLLNIPLRQAGLNKIKSTPIINGMVDYGLTENFSLGGAYSFHQWNWQDEFQDTVTNISTFGNVNAARHNIGLRGLFHFGSNENVDMYAGARIGYSLWRAKTDAVSTNGESVSEFAAPPGIFTAQALFGARAYFNEWLGANVEFGVGTAPYFLAGGLSFRIR